MKSLGFPRDNLGVCRDNLGVSRDNLGVSKDNLSLLEIIWEPPMRFRGAPIVFQ